MSDEEKKEIIIQLYNDEGINIELDENEFQVMEAYVEIMAGRRKKPK